MTKPISRLPYGLHSIDEDDVAAVADVLKSDWLTTGPKVEEFERALAAFTTEQCAVAVCNGTAALHAAVYAAGVGPGDEVLVATMSFAASANCVVFQGAIPVFVDVRDYDLLIDPGLIESKITAKTKAIIAVDYAGLPCDYEALVPLARKHGLVLIADACHSIGGAYQGHPAGSLADISVFSFHPVKNMTTGEGGALVTNNPEYARRARVFRNHGIASEFRERQQLGVWEYDMADLGWNYRITDGQCALGLSQLKKLPGWIARRNEIAAQYTESFKALAGCLRLVPSDAGNLPQNEDEKAAAAIIHGRHLYVIRVPSVRRKEIFSALRERGLGVNVHYRPIHLHSFYQRRFGTGPGLCPVAESAYEEIITLPMYPSLSDTEVAFVIQTVSQVCEGAVS